MGIQTAIAMWVACAALAGCCLEDSTSQTTTSSGTSTGDGCHAGLSVPGLVTTLAADGDAGAAAPATFSKPRGIAVDALGNVYVSDFGLGQIDRIDCDNVLSRFSPASPAPLGDFGIDVDSAGNVYAASSWTSAIMKTDPKGNVTTVAGNGTEGWVDGPTSNGSPEFNQPSDVAVDALGNLFVADTNNNRIPKIDTRGNVTTLAGDGNASYQDGTGGPQGTAEFNAPQGVAVDTGGNVYVADTGNSRVRKIASDGTVTTLAGNGIASFQDGTGGPRGTAEFNLPLAIAVDSSDDVYVADGTNRIRRIDSTGNVTTFAGNGAQGAVDGTVGVSGTAEFFSPQGLAVDPLGNVYVTDVGNLRIRMITP